MESGDERRGLLAAAAEDDHLSALPPQSRPPLQPDDHNGYRAASVLLPDTVAVANPQPGSRYGSINRSYSRQINASGERSMEELQEATLEVSPQRWYILIVFSLLAFLQGGLCNIWLVIAESAEAAFGWTDVEVSLMQGWIFVSFLLTMFPFSWLIDTKGLRLPMILAAILIVIGAALRCITADTPWVTWLAHTAHIFNGCAAPVVYNVGPVISNLWFPPKQRATATAIGTIAGFAGNAGCFLEGPLLVESPKPAKIHPHSNSSQKYSNIDDIKLEILHCRYGEVAIAVLLLVCIVVYYPSRPTKHPSISASMGKKSFLHSIKPLFSKENANFWLLAIPFGMVVSIYAVWSSMLDVNLKSHGISEREAGWLGFYSVAAGCVAAVFIGWLSDHMVGKMKLTVILLVGGCIMSTLAFLFISQNYIPFSHAGLYVSCILMGLFANGTVPLFFELSIETTYPIAEVAVSMMLNITYNAVPFFFLLIFLIPNIGKQWMNWCLYCCLILALPLLIAFKERLKRRQIDTSKCSPADPEPVNS